MGCGEYMPQKVRSTAYTKNMPRTTELGLLKLIFVAAGQKKGKPTSLTGL